MAVIVCFVCTYISHVQAWLGQPRMKCPLNMMILTRVPIQHLIISPSVSDIISASPQIILKRRKTNRKFQDALSVVSVTTCGQVAETKPDSE